MPLTSCYMYEGMTAVRDSIGSLLHWAQKAANKDKGSAIYGESMGLTC